MIPNLLALGRPLPNWSGPMPAGSQLFMDYGGSPFLMILLDKPRREEVAAMQRPARFGLLPYSDHTLFLLYSIPGLTIDDWGDAPFALGNLKPEDRNFGRCEPGSGWLFTLLLGDCTTGTIHAMRQSTITPTFSRMLDDTIERQREALPRFNRERHVAEVDEVYRKYPTSSALARDAVIVEQIGQPFKGRL